MHPLQVLLEVAGQDGTSRFRDIQHSTDAIEMTEQYVIGTVKKEASSGKETSVGISCYEKYRNCLYANIVVAMLAIGIVATYKYFRGWWIMSDCTVSCWVIIVVHKIDFDLK